MKQNAKTNNTKQKPSTGFSGLWILGRSRLPQGDKAIFPRGDFSDGPLVVPGGSEDWRTPYFSAHQASGNVKRERVEVWEGPRRCWEVRTERRVLGGQDEFRGPGASLSGGRRAGVLGVVMLDLQATLCPGEVSNGQDNMPFLLESLREMHSTQGGWPVSLYL